MKKYLILLLSMLSILMFSCANNDSNDDNEEIDDAQPIVFDSANYIKPRWDMNDVNTNEFYVKQQIRTINKMNNFLPLEEGLKKAVNKDDDELELKEEFEAEWSGDFYLKYKVVQTGFMPQEDNELYKYANLNNKKSFLTIIKGELAEDIQSDDTSLDEIKPALYLVIREDLGRMVAAVYFQTKNGKRVSEAYDLDDPSQKANFLSTTSMFSLPNFMPSFPIKKESQNIKLEDGTSFKSTYANNSIEVNYINKLDGTTILQKWDNNGIWAKETITSKMKSSLMTKDEVKKLRKTKRRTVKLDTPNDDFQSKLRKAVNLGKQLKLSDEILKELEENDGIADTEVEVPEEFLPWSGSYWPLDTASLAYGYSGENEKNKNVFNTKYEHPLKEGEKINVDESISCENSVMNLVLDLDEDGVAQGLRLPKEDEETLCEQTQKLAAQADALYKDIQDEINVKNSRSKRSELRSKMTTAMIRFFATLNSDMKKDNTGRIQIHNNEIIGYDESENEIWSFDLNKQSPMMKYAIWHRYTQMDWQMKNPFQIVAWEILNSYHPMVGTGWWGHCNGWSGATIFVRDPATLENGKLVKELVDGETITFDVGDLKGLLTESFYSGSSHFYGSRYNDKENDHDKIKDLVPSSFHKLVSIYLRDRGIPFVFDTYAGSQVWNFPVYGYDFTIMETTDLDAYTGDKININKADVKELDKLWGIGKKSAQNIIAYREHNGPFQKIEDIMNVKYITERKFEHFKKDIAVGFEKPSKRTFDVEFTLNMASDSYSEDWAGDLKNSSEHRFYTYTLETDKEGNIVGAGEWGQDDEHPDFAWIPYSNKDNSRGSENSYLKWRTLQNLIPAELLRLK